MQSKRSRHVQIRSIGSNRKNPYKREREHFDSSGEFYYKSIAQFGEAFET